MRRGAGTGAGYSVEKGHQSNRPKQHAQSLQATYNARKDIDESDSCYIQKSNINSQTSQNQSQSQMTSERSNFTSIEGPPKVYEEIMQQLEADIRKHIRIEHQLKLHIESVEDRIEELERDEEGHEKEKNEFKSVKE